MQRSGSWKTTIRRSGIWVRTAQKELNGWVKTSPNVYYYSIANHATEQGSFCCNDTDRLIAPIQLSSYQYARTDMIFPSRTLPANG